MNSSDDFEDGTPVRRGEEAGSAAVRRTSNAFGSPGTDSTVKRLDLNDAFIRHPEATFIVRAAGDDMRGAGIANGDVLLVDRSLTAQHGSVIIAVVAGELRCRLLEQPAATRGRPTVVRLAAADPSVPPVVIDADTPLEVWGVVTTVIKSLV
jgi:DNA polymerase V